MHDVFISYSRKNIDFARKLEKSLREYRPPRDANVAQHYLDVFRDEADFTGADYFQSVGRQLAESTKLVVVCSPAARASTYVNDEIRRFAQARGAENIVAVLLDGIPNNERSAEDEADLAFPDALCEALKMPLAIPYIRFDAKKDRVDRGFFAGSWFSLLANVYGVSRADVEQREKRRQARNRRFTIGIVSAVITALAVALVVSLMFWRQAVEQRGIAEKARDQERAARIAEATQRKLADERRQEADRQRASAVREAISARSQTAGRVAVQALEKLDGAPDRALSLGITAVDTFHSHKDPLVLPAVGALQKINLAFAASRLVFPQHTPDSVVFDASLEWEAASDPSGKILFGETGSVGLRPIPLPRGVLARDERWATERARLLFTAHHLIAAVGIVRKGQTGRGLILSWPLSQFGLDARSTVVSSFPLSELRTVRIVASPDERWLFWTDGWNRGFLQRMDGAGASLPLDCASFYPACNKAFSPDSRMFLVQNGSSIRRFALADGKPVEQLAMETRIGEAVDFATTAQGDLSGKAGNAAVRLAILGINGEVEWWQMSDPSPERHTLTSIFSAYQKDLEVYGLESREIRGRLEWRTGGEGILVSVAEAKGEFGIAAFYDLKTETGWQPIEHRYESKAQETRSETHGTVGGPREGYSIKNAANLGVSSATWMTPKAVLTVGFDGTVLFRMVENRVADKYQLVATSTTSAVLVGRWIVLGKRDGKISLIDAQSEGDPVLVLNGHGAPLREVRAALDLGLGVTRLLSTDSAGLMRVWDMTSPIAHIPIDNNSHFGNFIVTSDWSWLVKNSGREFWPLNLPDPLWAPEHPAAFATANVVAWNADASQAASLRIEPSSAVLRLWSLGVGRPMRTLLAERRFPMASAGPYSSWWMLLATDKDGARVIIGRTDFKQKDLDLWITNPLRPGEPLRKLGDSEFTLHGASPDLQWLLVSGSAKTPKEMQLAHLSDWSRAPSFIPLKGMEIDFVRQWSRDGRWLALSGRRKSTIDPKERSPVSHDFVIDLGAAAISGHADQLAESSEGDIVFGYGSPPLRHDRKETLEAWQSPSGSKPHFVKVMHGLSNVAWDESGQWLAVTRDDRVWLARLGSADSPVGIGSQIEAALRGPPLPPPAEAEAKGKVSRVFPFPNLGWIVAATNDHVLLWHRGADDVWEQPLVFAEKELRIDHLSNVRFRPDGRMACFDNQVLSFDPAYLMAYSRRLMAGLRAE